MKGGDGTVEVIPSVVQGEYESDANVIARLIFKTGLFLGMHEHIGEEEIITVLHGTAEYNDNGEKQYGRNRRCLHLQKRWQTQHCKCIAK